MAGRRVVLTAVAMILLLSNSAAAQQGQAVFQGKGACWTCHGREGKGTPLGPDLSDQTWLNIDGSLESIRGVVRTGVPKPKQYPAPMPPMGGAKLNAAEIDAVADYVLSLSRAPGTASRGRGPATPNRVPGRSR